MTRYYSQFGDRAEPAKAMFYLKGPQRESEIPEAVRRLLDMPGVTEVDVRFATTGGDRIQVFQKMPGEPSSDE